MTFNKRKKVTKQRGHHTHGWGAKKKHRGSGNRGGFGMAGTGKRADQKKPTIINLYGNSYFGKRGFNRPQKYLDKPKTINLDKLKNIINKLVESKQIAIEGNLFILDGKKIKYNKILGSGNIDIKLKLINIQVTKNAAEKIKEAGGIIESENDNKDISQ